MSKKSPQLRFEGFTDDWEERKLGDVVGEIQSGNRLPKDSLTNGDVPYVVAQTKNDGVFKKIARGTLDYNGNPMKLFPGNSISFSIDNPEAMFYRNAEFYTSNIMRVIHEDHLTHEQYVFILENMKRFIRGYDWSRKFSGPVVSNLEYLQPSEEEQQKIGSFFKQLDDTIALHQRKLDLLKEQKKGYLQKMFPKNGAKVPELRFAGFADDWEERKLSDGTNKIGDGLHGTPKYSEDGEVYFVNGNNLVNGQIVIVPETKRVTSNEQSKDDKALNESTILMSINGTIGNLAWYRGENLMLGKSAAYIEVSDFDKKFIYAYLQTRPVKDYYLNSLTGTTIKNLGLKAIRNTNICTPTIDEQAKIGSFFKKLDDTIALHQRKLDLLKEQKKGFLQKMFV
ncbi:restriction endonuclease subunit S [Lactococcus petauri]|uniref:restriction endonuclease subunit S n=1 Tax=Lactococcus petauri TaxID=1940789 RepID=UPI003A4D8AD0